MTEGAAAWARAISAVELFAVNPAGLGGLWVRGRAGPIRSRFLAQLERVFPRLPKLPPAAGDDVLFGALDLAATLAERRVVMRGGLLDKGGPIILTMAERCPPGLAVRLGQALDAGVTQLIALDETASDDEGLPTALQDRLGLFIDLDGIAAADLGEGPDLARIESARALPRQPDLPPDAADTITRVAARLSISSLRAPSFALAAARGAAALGGRERADEDDLALAAAMTLAHRGVLPPEPAPPPDEMPEPPPPCPDQDNQTDTQLPDDLLVEAVRSALPAGLLAELAMGRAARSAKSAGGAGAARKGNRRGRPLPSRPGRLDGQSRIDIVATLRTAAPLQKLRQQATGRDGLELRPDDIRLKRYQETSDRLLIFAVDASGSSALARLGEAKGAIELLLAEAYVRRDHVALIAFRGSSAELVLPPTRSLVQTKRRLGGMPGGGGTPLAAGLRAALELSLQTRARGMTPTLALLTDGRANIALDGNANRDTADADARRLARAIRAAAIPGLVIDTGSRPQPALSTLSADLGATYLPLPRADAARMSAALSAALSVT